MACFRVSETGAGVPKDGCDCGGGASCACDGADVNDAAVASVSAIVAANLRKTPAGMPALPRLVEFRLLMRTSFA